MPNTISLQVRARTLKDLIRHSLVYAYRKVSLAFWNLWHGSAGWVWFSVLLAGAISVASVGEFGGGLAISWLSLISLSSKYWHWAESCRWTILKNFRHFVVVPVLLLCGLSFFEVNEIRGSSPWSHIPRAWHQMMIATTVEIQQMDIRFVPPGVPIDDVRLAPNKTLSTAVHEFEPKIQIVKSDLRTGLVSNQDLYLEVEVAPIKSPITVMRYDVAAVMPIVDDGRLQAEHEDVFWNMLLEKKRSGDLHVFEFELPANQDLGFRIHEMPLSEGLVKEINSGEMGLYFLSTMSDKKGKTLMNLCEYIDKYGRISYCRKHNNP